MNFSIKVITNSAKTTSKSKGTTINLKSETSKMLIKMES